MVQLDGREEARGVLSAAALPLSGRGFRTSQNSLPQKDEAQLPTSVFLKASRFFDLVSFVI